MFIILAELLSLFSFYFSSLNNIIFIIISVSVLALSIYKLEYGLWVVLVELFIGSMGQLFVFQLDERTIPIRMALWGVLMLVWIGKVVGGVFFGEKDSAVDDTRHWRVCTVQFFGSSYFKYYFVLFLFVTWGAVNGYLNNSINNLFFDFNGWVYFGLLFPVYDIIKDKKSIENLLLIFSISILWIFIKTLFLLFFFSHSSPFVMKEIYTWVRDTRIGEVTLVQGGFYRIFFQSHIFALVGFFIFLTTILDQITNYKLQITNKFKISNLKITHFLISVALVSAIIISLSRSFWVGFIFGIILISIYL